MRIQRVGRNQKNIVMTGASVGVATLMFGGLANAQSYAPAPDGFILAADLEGVQDVIVNPDGSVTLVFTDGRRSEIVADDVLLDGSNVYIELDAIDTGGGWDVPTPALVLGAVAGGVGLIALIDDDGLANRPPEFVGSASETISENTSAGVFTASASDPDDDVLIYSISGGADASLFDINADSGVISFKSSPDFESPTDSNGDNSYQLIIGVSDGEETVTRDITIIVTDLNDTAPAFTSATAASVAENGTVTDYAAEATDVEGDAVVYAIVGGADAALFAIDATTGVVSLTAAQDFEAPGDADADGVYEIIIQAGDGINTSTQSVRFTLEDLNEAPSFVSGGVVTADEGLAGIAYTAAALDPDDDALTYSISGGADANLFSINAATGEVSFIATPDFENPGDANLDNVYEIEVSSSDGAESVSRNVEVTINDVNEAPFISSGTMASFDENAAGIAYDADASDPDGGMLTYAISGGADAALFSIDASTGEVSFIASPDFESPGDNGADNVYELTVSASDGAETVTRSVEITVGNLNDSVPVISSAAAISVSENSTGLALDVDASDLDGDALNYAIIGTDAGLFSIDAATGEISFNSPPDFEAPSDGNADSVYEITVRVSDGVNDAQQGVQITVTNENDNDPVLTSGSSASLAENFTSVAYTAAAGDADGDSVTYSIAGGADAALFTIDQNNGALSFITPPDFEQPGDQDLDNTYEVLIEANDGVRSAQKAVSIDVTNVNDNTPSFTSSPNYTADENQTAVGQVTANDLDGDTLTYSIIFGPDQNLFTIDQNTGALSFINAPDFENQGDQNVDNVYEILVRVTDGTTTVDQSVFVTVGNTNDNAPQFTVSQTAFSVSEGATGALGIVDATDADGSTLNWSVSGGPDASAVAIDSATGELSLAGMLDFENPSDADTDNVYSFDVAVSDGVATDTITLTVTVTNLNDVAPVFSSGTTVTQQENTTVTGYSAAAADSVEGDPVTYSISGGADGALFAIDANAGSLSFINAPDFENPADAGADNVYEVTVRANDGANDTDQTVQITVSDIVNEQSPAFTSGSTMSFDENATGVAYTATATDPQNDPVAFSITGGADASLFSINGTTGEVTFNGSPDFENPADANSDNAYEIEITASDGANQTVQAVQINVNNLNDNSPVFTSSTNWAYIENTIVAVAARSSATDADGDTLTYSIAGGADAALFTIDASTGTVRFVSSPDFEAPTDADLDNVYELTLEASDGTNAAQQSITIAVQDQNDNAPEITTGFVTTPENAIVNIPISVSDADSNSSFNWSITGGLDGSLFTIDANTGEISFINPPDFEAPADSNQDNFHEVEVTVSDGAFTDSRIIGITVNDLNEGPTRTQISENWPSVLNQNLLENNPNLTPNWANAWFDPEGDPITISLAGVDAGLFTILPAGQGGQILPNNSFDFENPIDANSDGIYEVNIVVTSSNQTDTQDLTITIVDVNEPPEITSSSSRSAAENQSSVFTATAVDPEAGAILWQIAGGADASRFRIDATTGDVVFGFPGPADFESADDADTDGIYEIEIIASSAGQSSAAQLVQITLTDENDIAPVFTSGVLASVAENLTNTGYSAVASDPDAGDPIAYSVTGGADGGLFSIDTNTGALSFINAPDFENPSDQNTDNVYEVIVRANDGVNDTDQTVQITVTDVVMEGQPVISSSNTATFAEQGPAANTVFTATATDPQNDPITWSIVGGPDANFFFINPIGVVGNSGLIDFENPQDADQDNVYEFTIQASDGANNTQQNVFVTITDRNDNPTVLTSGASSSAPENSTGVVYTAAATDADSFPIAYSLSGTDAALFTIDSSTGEVVFNAAPNFEAPRDSGADNVYDITVLASQTSQSASQAVSISVTDVSEAPTITGPAAFTSSEDNFMQTFLSFTDPDTNELYTWSIVGGADASLFWFDATPGTSTAPAPAANATPSFGLQVSPDADNPGDANQDNVYEVEVQLSDGTNTVNQALTFTVTDVNDNPTTSFVSILTGNIDENLTGSVFTITQALDDDIGAVIRFAASGPDSAFFNVDSITGAITVSTALDFENPQDANLDNLYEFTVTAFDDRPGVGAGATSQQFNVLLSINDVADTAQSLAFPFDNIGAEGGFDPGAAISNLVRGGTLEPSADVGAVTSVTARSLPTVDDVALRDLSDDESADGLTTLFDPGFMQDSSSDGPLDNAFMATRFEAEGIPQAAAEDPYVCWG